MHRPFQGLGNAGVIDNFRLMSILGGLSGAEFFAAFKAACSSTLPPAAGSLFASL